MRLALNFAIFESQQRPLRVLAVSDAGRTNHDDNPATLRAAESFPISRRERVTFRLQLHNSLVLICLCDIVSMVCTSMHGVRIFIERVL